MKRFLGILIGVCMMVLAVGCGEEIVKEQSATYVFTQVEADMYTMTDTQTLDAKGDIVYQLQETTTLEFAALDDTTLNLLVSYYDETVAAMKENAPEGVEVASSYEGNIYTMEIKLDLETADIQSLVAGGYLMGLNEEKPENFTFISFDQTCAGLEASGYTLKK